MSLGFKYKHHIHKRNEAEDELLIKHEVNQIHQ